VTAAVARERAASRLLSAGFALGLAVAVCGSGCIVRLSRSDDEPLSAGDVSGPPADCSKGPAEDLGKPGGGAAGPRVVGRYDVAKDGAIRFQWSGTEIHAAFQGTGVKMALKVPFVYDLIKQEECPDALVNADPKVNDCNTTGRFPTECCIPLQTIPIVVRVDDGPPQTIQVAPEIGEYELAKDLDASKPHEITVHRSVEAAAGIFEFRGFTLLGNGARFLSPIVRSRRIEVIGDSISCGYGILGANASCRFSYATEDHFESYDALTARALSADLTTIAWSGRGILRNNTGDTTGVVGDFYDRALPVTGEPDDEGVVVWDFAKAAPPQVVVINVGTNDFFLGVPDSAQFEGAYNKLIDRVRKNYPQAHIFCAIPPMLSDVPADTPRTALRDILHRVVGGYNSRGDARVYSMEFLDQGVRRGLGCDFHPNKTTHQIMADQLTAAIKSKTCW
jgi:lysophospholipase L1-like esterase